MVQIDEAIESHEKKITEECEANPEKADALSHEAELIDNVRECASLENVMNFPDIEPQNTELIKGMVIFQG